MFIHFAFGALGRQGKIEEQTTCVIEYILKEKRLKVSKCKEFMPDFPQKGAKRIPPAMFKATDYGAAATFYPQKDPNWLNKLPDDTNIHYLPLDVPMICFIRIPFSQLRNSTHPDDYGKLGIVLTNNYLISKGIKPVYYYTEESLWNDPLIKKWNYGSKYLSKKEKAELTKEIVSYRKPATLFSSFKESVTMKITRTSPVSKIEYLTYDRYRDGYDFSKENEYRIVFDEGVDYLYFNENDLFMIITPNLKAKTEIEAYLNQVWTYKPQVKIYPD